MPGRTSRPSLEIYAVSAAAARHRSPRSPRRGAMASNPIAILNGLRLDGHGEGGFRRLDVLVGGVGPWLFTPVSQQQVIVACEPDQKLEGIRPRGPQTCIDYDAFDAVRDDGCRIRRVAKTLVPAEMRHDAAQAFGPVARTEHVAGVRDAEDD